MQNEKYWLKTELLNTFLIEEMETWIGICKDNEGRLKKLFMHVIVDSFSESLIMAISVKHFMVPSTW